MKIASGTYRSGRVDLDEPVNWEEGARVSVVAEVEPLGLTEETWPSTREALAEWLSRFDVIEPLELTAVDEAEITAARAVG